MVRALSVYLSELDAWRRRINLTGRLSPEDLADHALEAVPAVPLIADGARVVDIGSGAGLPAIPLAILRPSASFTLFEPVGKKAAFLRHAVRTLGLGHVAVADRRFADVGGPTFEVATTRGVGSLQRVIGSGAFLTPGGRLLVWTTTPARLESELKTFRLASALPIPGSRSKVVAVLVRATFA